MYDTWSQWDQTAQVCLSVLRAGAAPFAGISPGDIYREIGAGRRPSTLGCCNDDMYVLKCACVVWSLIWGLHGMSVVLAVCRFVLLQRCWQHSPIDRPFFGSLQNDLEQMIDDPGKHIHLRLMEEEGVPGYLDEGNVAHLFRPPRHLLDDIVLRSSSRRTPLLQVSMHGSVVGCLLLFWLHAGHLCRSGGGRVPSRSHLLWVKWSVLS